MARPKGSAPSWERQKLVLARLQEGWTRHEDLQLVTQKPERTVRRDLQTLQEQGYELEERWSGTHKEWRIDPETVRRPVEPGVLEIIALTLGRGLLGFLEGTELRGEMEGLFKNLLQNSRATDRQRDDLDRKFWFMPDAPRDYSGADDQLNEICTCLLDQRRAEIFYRSRGRGVHHVTVEPYTLVVRRECLYVLAHVPEEGRVRLFDLTRIQSIRRLRERFEVRPDYTPSAPFVDAFGVFIQADGPPERVRVWFLEDVARSIENRSWHPSQRWVQSEAGRILEMDVRVCPELVRWVLGFGATAWVLGPPSLLQQVSGALRDAAASYEASARGEGP